jgi:hypothetical protein
MNKYLTKMKRLLITFGFMLAGFFPLLAQDKEVAEVTPIEKAEVKKADVPLAVTKAATTDFKDYIPTKFSTVGFKLMPYGWSANTDIKEDLDHYELHLTANNGSYLDALYSPDGNLERYKKVIKNEVVPKAIMESIATSEYKDWKLTADQEIITGDPREVKDHYIIKLKNGAKTKTLFFTDKGVILTNK